MAIIKCPECGKDISNKAPSCPHCGLANPAKELDKITDQETVEKVEEVHTDNTPSTESKTTKDSSDNDTPVENTNDSPKTENPCQESNTDNNESNIATNEPTEPNNIAKSMEKIPKKIVAIILAILIIVGVIFFVLYKANVFSKDKKVKSETIKVVKDTIIFFEDKEIYYAKIGKEDKKQQVTTDLFTNSNLDETYVLSLVATSTYISPDGKKIFYPDKIDLENYYDDGFNIYCRSTTNWEEEPIKIDSNVLSYCINENASIVTYVKDGCLYQNNFEERTKIDSEISQIYLSEDCKTFIYSNYDGDIYTWNSELGEKNKLATNSIITYVSDDLSTIYYLSDYDSSEDSYYCEGTLYRFQINGEKEKIDTNVFGVCDGSTDNLFYVTVAQKEINVFDAYFNDDTIDSDNYILNADYDESGFDNISDWYDALDIAEIRQAIREDFDYTENETIFTLKCYDAKANKSNVVLENFEYYSDWDISNGIAAIISSSKNIEKINMSYFDLYTTEDLRISDIDEMINEAITYTFNTYSYSNGKLSTIVEGTSNEPKCGVCDNNILVLGFDTEDNKLYSYSCEADGSLEKSVYDDDVDDFRVFTDKNKSYVITLKNENEEKETHDLYINKELIDYDVSDSLCYELYNEIEEFDDLDCPILLGFSSYYSNMKNYLYITDINCDFLDYSEKVDFTLKYKGDGKPIKIADDVDDGILLPDKSILYLSDYSFTSYYGTLTRYLNGEKTKISDDCNGLIPIFTYKDSIERFQKYPFGMRG